MSLKNNAMQLRFQNIKEVLAWGMAASEPGRGFLFFIW